MEGENADTAFALWAAAADLRHALIENRDLRDALREEVRCIPDSSQYAVFGDGADATLLVLTENAAYTLKRVGIDDASKISTTRRALSRVTAVTVARGWRTLQAAHRVQVSTWSFEFDAGASILTFTSRRPANEANPPLEDVAQAMAECVGWGT